MRRLSVRAVQLRCRTGDSMRAFEVAWALIGGRVENAARRFTEDVDLRADLVQEARIALWRADPTRFNLGDASEQAYLRGVAFNRMRDAWRQELARRGLASRGKAA